MTAILGFLTPFFTYSLITILHWILPGKWIKGYVKQDSSNDLIQYRLNGRLVLACCLLIWFILGYLDIVPYDWFYQVRWYSLGGAFLIGIIYSYWMVYRFPPVKKNFWQDFYLGRAKNPQISNGKLDHKMWLYMIGAVMLELHICSFTSYHYQTYGIEANLGVYLCAAMLSWFVLDYLSFEKVHIYTYDIFAERVGFKLGWGCLCFYPYFYSIALWSVVDKPANGIQLWQMIVFSVLFLIGWSLARGANMQKFFFKKNPNMAFLGITPEIVTDGKKSLLSNGFWGISRHVNYLGEILMGLGIALSVNYPMIIGPWLYPLYYVALLVPRERDDDRRCAKKYGTLWEQYTQKVRYRIIPGIY